MIKSLIVVLATGYLFSSAVYAGDCTLMVTRTACPGKDSESFKKCAGKAVCEPDVKEDIGTEDACKKAALDDCTNKRFDITKYKVVKAKFGGKDLDGGKDYCKEKSGTYDPDKNFPFRSKDDCK